MQETLSWAVKFRTSDHRKTVQRTDYDQIAHRISKELNLQNQGQVGELLNHYLFVHSSYNDTFEGEDRHTDLQYIQRETEALLRKHPDVEWFHRQRIRRRTKRSLDFKDPSYRVQWHLHNHKSPGMDINVTEVWEHNITGTGVVVAVIDDGLEWNNEDLLANYNAKGSWDLNNNDPDPMPEVHKEDDKSLNRHGTRCAGEIAAVANNKCSVGVAFTAQISGIRLLDGPMTDSLEATAFNKNMHINDIYSCSWGPDDDGKTVDGPHPLAQAALKHGVTAGRKGLGSIFVVASGNGGRNEDNCNYDGYANSMYTVTIGAVDESGQMPYYAEQCASMLAVTFSSGAANKRNIVTTDWTLAKGTGCTSSHTGTSAAAPLAAGMIALMLQAKPCLTWRDIQHIIVHTALKVDEKNAVWITNAGGFHHSHKHGFGLLNAWRLVNAAKAWHTVPWLMAINPNIVAENKKIFAGKSLKVTQSVSNSTAEQNELEALEHVLVTVTLSHIKRGMLQIQLVCPSGTTSIIGARRKKDDSGEGLKSWTFSTVRCWGEKPAGEWTLIITDNLPVSTDGVDIQKGLLLSWKLTLYGSSMNAEEMMKRKLLVSEAMSGIFLDANLTEPCSYYWNAGYDEEGYLSSKAMKILLYVSGLFTLMAIYYSLEQAFCNSEDKEKDEEEGDHHDVHTSVPHERHTGGDEEETMHLLEEIPLARLEGLNNEVQQRAPPQESHTGCDGEQTVHLLEEIPRQTRFAEVHSISSDELLRDEGHLGCDRDEQGQFLEEVRSTEVLRSLTKEMEHPCRDSGVEDSDHERISHSPFEFDTDVRRESPVDRSLPVTFTVENRSLQTNNGPSELPQVQYTTPSNSEFLFITASKTNVPVAMEIPSQHPLPFAEGKVGNGILVQPFAERIDPSLIDGKRRHLELPLVSSDPKQVLVWASTAGQFTGENNSQTVCDISSLEQSSSLATSAERQPITSGLLSCAMCGMYNSSEAFSSSVLIGAYVCGQCVKVESGLSPNRLGKTDEKQTQLHEDHDMNRITNEQASTMDEIYSCPPFFQDC